MDDNLDDVDDDFEKQKLSIDLGRNDIYFKELYALPHQSNAKSILN